MEKNVCHIVDRSIRIIAGLALLSLLITDSKFKWLGLIGLVPLATVAIGFCPGYALFGLSSCPTDEKKD